MHRNVWVLTVAQVFMMSMNSLNVFVGGLVGATMAPSPELSTLPVATVIVGTAAATIPVTLLMERLGRRLTFLYISGGSVLVALLATYAITIDSFYLFTTCTFLLGINGA
ncbi:MAG: MFS transporter, partial [Bacteroidota bacterium]